MNLFHQKMRHLHMMGSEPRSKDFGIGLSSCFKALPNAARRAVAALKVNERRRYRTMPRAGDSGERTIAGGGSRKRWREVERRWRGAERLHAESSKRMSAPTFNIRGKGPTGCHRPSMSSSASEPAATRCPGLTKSNARANNRG